MDLNNMDEPTKLKMVKHFIEEAVKAAEQAGVVVTVMQVPQEPLGMGNYITAVSVRPCRQLSAPRQLYSQFVAS